MSYQFKALQLSFIIHVFVLMIIIGISNSIAPVNKLLVIDFSIEESDNITKNIIQKSSPALKKQKAVTSKTVDSKPSLQNNQMPKMEQKKEKAQDKTPALSSPIISETKVPVVASNRTTSEERNQDNSDIQKKTGESTQSQTSGYTKHQFNTDIRVVSDSGTASSHENINMQYLKKNFSYIRDLIQKKIVYPRIARQMGWEGKVKVVFTISSDGRVKDIKIAQTSGIEILDRNALTTVKKASPFPKPPAEAQLIIPIVYRLD